MSSTRAFITNPLPSRCAPHLRAVEPQGFDVQETDAMYLFVRDEETTP